MADEVLEAATEHKRDYTLKSYEVMQSVLVSKADALNTSGPVGNNVFNAECIGKALWAAAMTSVYDISEPGLVTSCKKRVHETGATTSSKAEGSVSTDKTAKRRK